MTDATVATARGDAQLRARGARSCRAHSPAGMTQKAQLRALRAPLRSDGVQPPFSLPVSLNTRTVRSEPETHSTPQTLRAVRAVAPRGPR